LCQAAASAGGHQRIGLDLAPVADDGVFVDHGLVVDHHVAPQDAAGEASVAPCAHSLPVDDALEHRAALDEAAVADDERADELDAGLDDAAGADQDRRLEVRPGGDLGAIADPDVGCDLAARQVELDAPEQGVEVAEAVLLDVADVVPVRLERPHVKRHAGAEQRREDVSCPVDEQPGVT
jgi:hypothetical protein